LPSGNANAPVIERRYLSQSDACTEAVKTLLKKKGRLTDKVGPDDATLKYEKEVGHVDRWTDSRSGIAISDHESED
jgi:hypothetical protein